MNQSGKIDPAVIEYIAEGKEIIERVSTYLNSIESGQFTQETLSSLYRDVHTLKGTSQLFGFKKTAQISHALEASLDPIRRGTMSMNARIMQACSKNIDLIDRLLNAIETTGTEFEDESEVVKLVSLLVDASTNHDPPSETVTTPTHIFEETLNAPASNQTNSDLERNVTTRSPHSVSASTSQSSTFAPTATSQNLTQKSFEEPFLNASLQQDGAAPSLQSPVGDATIRVQVNLLDRILNLVGELVLVRNQLVQYRNKIEDPNFLNTSKNLDVVTSELQGEIMKTRMQPIDTVVGKFTRTVKDIARDLGKRIDLTLEGSETELDKSLLEAIKDPLTHLVRNSCDHGIEFPEERRKANKPETGHLLIRSYHEGGQVVMEISDDGRGINRQKVLKKAVERGLMNSDKASRLSDREICELVFLPGFSTAQHVTAVSGRGVGMDVVKTNVEKIGGSVEIKSTEGKGTSVQFRIPLTLAIVPALIVKSNLHKFAIPQVKLVELVRIEPLGHGVRHIENLQGRPMLRLRGQLLPLFDLREITAEPFNDSYPEGAFVVVLSTEGEHFGLLVPEILDTADIVVKPMSALLNNLSTFSGATILGDGSLALILDVGGIAEFGKVLNKRAQKEDLESYSKQVRARISTEIQEFLVFSLGTDAHHALPLCLVTRLEEFPESAIEKSGNQRVVRYREGLLPLIALKYALDYAKGANSSGEPPTLAHHNGRIPVIVVQRSGRNYGLVVDEIIDVTTIEGQIDDAIKDRTGILGNLIHEQKVIVVIDALGIIEDFNTGLGAKKATLKLNPRDVMNELRSINKERKLKSVRVLYAEDVAFFRRHVSKVLAEAGIDVTTVEDGLKALQELDASESDRYNLVLSDIEMPHMTGLELAAEIRKRERYQNIPLIALTTRYRERDIEEGMTAGFDAYLEKLNPEKLLASIQELMGPTQKTSRNELKEGVVGS